MTAQDEILRLQAFLNRSDISQSERENAERGLNDWFWESLFEEDLYTNKERAMDDNEVVKAAVQFQEKTQSLVPAVLKFQITDRATFEEAGRMSKALNDLDNSVCQTFDPLCADADRLHKKLCQQRTTHRAPLLSAINHIKLKSREFLLEEDRKKKEEEARILRERQEAERKAREEREKAEREAREIEEERIKQQEEADRLLNEAAEKERQAELAKSEEEQQKLKAESDALFTKAVEATPGPVVAVTGLENVLPYLEPPKPSTPVIRSVPGLGSRKVWKWRIKDKLQVPREFLVINETVLNALCRTSREPDPISGIEFYEDIEMRRRS